jgi:hypothetical protein
VHARWLRFVAAAGLTSAVILTGLEAASSAADSPARSGVAEAAPGSVRWTSVQAGTGHAIAADPDGDTVFAVGSVFLVAYDAATGAQLWDNSQASGVAVAVSPDGNSVFVIKAVHESNGATFSTSAYSAATGTLLWTSLYHGKAPHANRPTALAVSPSGRTVFVTGSSNGRTSGQDFATVAYAAASGKQLWVSRYNSGGHDTDIPVAIAVSPSGTAVFVTGSSSGPAGEGVSTVAYATASGRSLCTRRYYQRGRTDEVASMAVSSNGKRVFVIGTGIGLRYLASFTVAYAAPGGGQLWVRTRHGEFGDDVLVSPVGGGTVIVAGNEKGDLPVIAYSAATGRQKWARRIGTDNFKQEYPGQAALSPDGRTCYLVGNGDGAPGAIRGTSFTIAANVATGSTAWSHTVSTDTPAPPTDLPLGVVAASPDGGPVYMGVQNYTASLSGFTTVALRS